MIDEKKLLNDLDSEIRLSIGNNTEVRKVLSQITDVIHRQPQIQLEYETGKWMGSVCSCCGESVSEWYNFKFCPMCGAKMEGYKE